MVDVKFGSVPKVPELQNRKIFESYLIGLRECISDISEQDIEGIADK